MRSCRNNRRSARGFTLIEVAIVTVVIGTAVVALLQLLAAGTVSNAEGLRRTVAMNLAGSVHEMCLQMPSEDVMDLDGTTFSPPRDARNQAIADADDWSQVITVQNVDPQYPTLVVPDDSSDLMRVTVVIQRNGNEVHRAQWIQAVTD